ncbi:MAG: phenylalanine--tRNA ligase subunit beta [Candidatus Margulisbacteria bacterium]|jgi:phenylalanyl-tRNA synthetase beta chain|nr:phenylalanine--tRNA ligase subunit beta [Candidatus Margulisiibacteriota bacterium]
MRVPIEWLKELVSFRAGADQLAEMLTNGGLETVALPDEVLEVDVLPNRADAWSVRGIAREVSALTKFKINKAKVKIKETFNKQVKGTVKVEVRDQELCPRYMARVIENVKVGESPEWLKKRLELSGIRPINNVVDVTNYLLHELGQPMHAFDAALIKDQFIVVRRAKPGERVITLDEKPHELSKETLVIADPEKTIAVAGIMGCANTEVSSTTRTVILESAFFQPVSIHRTAKQIKTRTESSVRFEHGVDWHAVEEALDRGAALIAELARGDVLKGKIDTAAAARKERVIELRSARVNQLLGSEIPVGDMISILNRLGFGVKKAEGSKLKVIVPSFREMDIEREIDLVEEIARIWGFNRIEATMPNTAFPGKGTDREDLLRQRLRETLVGCGLNEVQSYSMIGPKEFARTGLSQEKAVRITNPLTVEGSIMRTNILPGLLNIAVHNQNRQVENVFIFEIGKVFRGKDERWLLGGLVVGSPFMSALDKGAADYSFIKGIVETLFRELGVELPKVVGSNSFLLQPGKGAEADGLGVWGALHPTIQRNYELTKPAFFFELDLDALFKLVPTGKRYQQLPKYPSVSRDISMFLPAGLEHQQIVELIERTGGDLVEDVYPFDKYQDSIAYRIVYRHTERTLTEDEVNKRHQDVVGALTTKLNVKIR